MLQFLHIARKTLYLILDLLKTLLKIQYRSLIRCGREVPLTTDKLKLLSSTSVQHYAVIAPS
jgi:hypothetical protein